MFRDPILKILTRDLLHCAEITLVAMVIMIVVALPVTFMAKNPDEFRALPIRLLRNWFVGVVHTAGSWIVLTALVDLGLASLTQPHDALILPLGLGYFMCLVVSTRLMWRSANTPAPEKPRRTFSLLALILTQVLLLAVCGLWMACRRGEIEQHYQLQADQARQTIPK